MFGGSIVISNRGGSAMITVTPSAIGATGMQYTWNYQGDNDGGNLSSGTVNDNVFTFNNSGGWSLIGGSRQTGTFWTAH